MCFSYFFMGPTKKIIQWIKHMCIFKGVHWIRTYVDSTLFEKNEVIFWGQKNIISGKISAVGFTQMNFNRI